MSQAESDRILLDGIRNDEPGAFERFVDLYGGRILAFGMRMCGQREDAHDVLQDTLMQAYRALGGLKEPGALRSWLYRVAANACLMKRRKGKFEPRRELSLEELMPAGPAEASAEIPDVSELPDEALERSELRASVNRAIDDLPEPYREVVVLRDIEQLSTQETARALDVPESTVKMRLHRARLMIRKQLLAAGDGQTGKAS